jgi:phosphoribosylpyrophosphate synthetase
VPTYAEITDPLLWTYTTVLAVGPGVCDICHAAPNGDFARCYSCYETARKVTRPVDLVVPISLYVVGEQLHHVLRRYKDSPLPNVRDTFRTQVAALLGRFLSSHTNCIEAAAGRSWQFLTTVPSSSNRIGTHPLVDAINMLPAFMAQLRSPLQPGAAPLSHNNSNDEGFVVTENVGDQSFLLIDDTFTTGARLQSAASALQIARADVVAALVIGRVINPEFSGKLWDRATKLAFRFDTCCLE